MTKKKTDALIDIYVHTIYYINGATQSFDSDTPLSMEKDTLCTIRFNGSNNFTIINTTQVNCIDIRHLTLTERQYEARRKLLNKGNV